MVLKLPPRESLMVAIATVALIERDRPPGTTLPK
jgi:hypothetical protein